MSAGNCMYVSVCLSVSLLNALHSIFYWSWIWVMFLAPLVGIAWCDGMRGKNHMCLVSRMKAAVALHIKASGEMPEIPGSLCIWFWINFWSLLKKKKQQTFYSQSFFNPYNQLYEPLWVCNPQFQKLRIRSAYLPSTAVSHVRSSLQLHTASRKPLVKMQCGSLLSDLVL